MVNLLIGPLPWNKRNLLNFFSKMHRIEVVLIVIVCLFYGVMTTWAKTSCETGSIPSECYQSCRHGECKCNTSETSTYDMCNQTCLAKDCFPDVTMTCIAKQNCTQVCQPGSCDMKCTAGDSCTQKAENGAKTMSCSSKECTQNCVEGSCEAMLCEAEHCLQTCGEGGSTMYCTESVKICSQRCTANKDCTLECRAEVCKQECSGPARCIILNAASSPVLLNFPAVFALVFFMLTV